MKKIGNDDIGLYDNEQLISYIKETSNENLREEAFQLSNDQVSAAIQALKEFPIDSSKAKLQALLEGVLDLKALEAIGHSINIHQLDILLDFASEHHELSWKLFPIFVAVPQSVFVELLNSFSEIRKLDLQQLCAAEAIQHHLFMFVHKQKMDEEELVNDLEQLHREISLIDSSDLTPHSLQDVINEIMSCAEKIHTACNKVENALALAWNSNRSDLIEALSSCRERYERLLFEEIGKSAEINSSSTGLFQKLEAQLMASFTEASGENVLDDDAPAIEALACLSIWYVKDYWEVGLLPEVIDPTQLALPFFGRNSDQFTHYHKEVEAKLAKMGLKTVKDFKKHLLVSKAMLQEFIRQFGAPL